MSIPRRIAVMGVSGCGKTTVGCALADRLGHDFLEGDELHPPENREAMAAGRPLTDADRAPWLDAIAARLADAPPRGVVVACSALKRAYRQRLARGGPVTFVHLALTKEIARERVGTRKGHFFAPDLVESQFSDLEPLGPDEAGITVDATDPLEAVIDAALRGLWEDGRRGT